MTGTGTENDPYIVSTWEEWLAVNDISASTYIKWGDAPKNKKVIQSSSVEANYLSGRGVVDFNDWTFVGFQGLHCNRGSEGAYPKFSNGIMVSVVSTDGNIIESLGTSSHTTWTIENFRISGTVSGNGITLINSSPYLAVYLKNSSITVNVNARYGDQYEEYLCYCNSSVYATVLTDCYIKFNSNAVLKCHNFDLYRNYFEGSIDTSLTSEKILTLTSDSKSNIWNIRCSRPLAATGQAVCVYNSDTCNITGTNYVGVTSAEIKSTPALLNVGLSISSQSSAINIEVSDFEQGGFYVGSSYADYDSTSEIRSISRYDFIPTTFTIDCPGYQWSFVCFDGSGDFRVISESLGYKNSGTLVDISAYSWVRYIRIELHGSSSISPPASCNIVYETNWYIDGIMNDGCPWNKYFPEPLGAFYNATELGKVSIPQSVKKIGRYSFWGTGLTEVTIARDCEYYPTSFPDGCVINFYPD